MAILSNFQANGMEAIKVLPPVQSNSLSYNGNAQSPTWTEYPTTVITMGTATPQVNAGTYSVDASLRSGCVWADTLKSGVRQVMWTIAKIAGGGALSQTSVELGSGESATVTVSRPGDGVITAESSDTSVATVSVSGTTVTITDGGDDGEAVITVHIAEGTNYFAMNDLMCEVSASHGQDISELPVGALVKCADFTYNGTVPIFRILEHGHSGDPSNSTTLEFRDIICNKAYDARENKNTDYERSRYGNNRYSYSNILQWLNSSAEANSWYTAKHTYDNPPNSNYVYNSDTAYQSEAGFLSFFPTNLRNILKNTTKTTALWPEEGSTENTTTKIFLLSLTEVTGNINKKDGQTVGYSEGSRYAYYNTYTSYNDWCKTYNGSVWYWWLRSPYMDYSYNVKVIQTNGTIGNYNKAYGSYGVSPAFCIPQTTKVSLAPDTDGAYILQL